MTKPTDALITAPELAGLLGLTTAKPVDPFEAVSDATALDVRWRLGGPPGRDLYDAGHIPGANFVDLDRDLAAPPGKGGRHPMPATADFERAMQLAGVCDGRLVVVYDDADSTAAARAWWLLSYFGHQNVRVLDGGFRSWTADGYPVSVAGQEPSILRAGRFTARPGQLPLLDADGAASIARAGLLLDARAGERYRGETEAVDPVAGHIPGAVSAPTAENVNADGTFKPAADLAARFKALGAVGDREVGAYCGSGVTAAHEVLALTLAGIPAALYVGSWSNWITDPTRPIATGPTPLPPQSSPTACCAAPPVPLLPLERGRRAPPARSRPRPEKNALGEADSTLRGTPPDPRARSMPRRPPLRAVAWKTQASCPALRANASHDGLEAPSPASASGRHASRSLPGDPESGLRSEASCSA